MIGQEVMVRDDADVVGLRGVRKLGSTAARVLCWRANRQFDICACDVRV